MKASARLSKTLSQLSDSTLRQLNMYALAAGTAGVGVLALSQPPHAEIRYTKVHQVIEPNTSYHLVLNDNNVTDCTIVNTTFSTDSGRWQKVAAFPSNAGVVGFTSDLANFASALKAGSPVGEKNHIDYAVAQMAAFGTGNHFRGGPWYNAGAQFLGLKFRINDQFHFGWARLKVTGKYPTAIVTVTGYAYQTIPNKFILAGKMEGSDVIAAQPHPAPVGLGRLALGAR
jgi:hypothetical protein